MSDHYNHKKFVAVSTDSFMESLHWRYNCNKSNMILRVSRIILFDLLFNSLFSVICNPLDLLRIFPGNPVPLNEGRNPGGRGDICGNGKDEGGRGICGRGPGNML